MLNDAARNKVLLSAAPQATNFPLPVTLGASFNTTLVQAVHQIIAAETRATGADIGYAPEVRVRMLNGNCIALNCRSARLHSMLWAAAGCGARALAKPRCAHPACSCPVPPSCLKSDQLCRCVLVLVARH